MNNYSQIFGVVRRHAFVALLVCAYVLTLSGVAHADKGLTTLVSSKRFAEAVALFKANEFMPSALILEDVAGKMSSAPQLSGIVYVMASKAAEKAGDGRAYDFWGTASARFARMGTSWSQVQREYGRKLEMVKLGNFGGGFSSSAQGGGLVAADAGRMYTAWKLFGLDSYNSPAQGLRADRGTGQIWNDVSQNNKSQNVIPYSEALWGEQGTKKSKVVGPPAIAPGRDMGYFRPDSRTQVRTATAVDINADEQLIARRAWEYFQRNYQPATGLYNGLDIYPVATGWEIGSSLAGLVCAQNLKIIQREDFLRRMQLLLRTLLSMDLYNGELPNRLYFTDTGRMVGEDQQPSSRGIGWSAVDCARLCLWLKIVGSMYPELKAVTENVFNRFRTERLIQNGFIQQASVWAGKEQIKQEGHFGYGTYAARALELWGLRPWASRDFSASIKVKTLYGVKVPYDSGRGSVLTAKPFFLGLMEFGNKGSDEDRMVQKIYAVQEARYKKTGVFTAVSDGRIDRTPWFATSGIVTDGGKGSWQCISPYAQEPLKLFWMGADTAVCMHSLYKTQYTSKLIKQIDSLYVDGKGFAAGRYDSGQINNAITLETNALVLEALWYSKLKKGFLEVGSVP
ncbi:MAG: DUF3131 domain-containing protein [Desulfovibrio sp.]